MSDYRDIKRGDAPATQPVPTGRRVVAVIGIDTYRNWGRLKNAVNDALGVQRLFRQLGFEELIPPLLNDAATFTAIRRLVITDLRKQLHEHDSLVLFFAGHGYTETSKLQSTPVRVGYIIPADSDAAGGDAGTWLELEAWLKDVSRLPPRHILVILDSCHSGMALELSRARGPSSEPLRELLSRRSRRVITSALDNQQALDDGPVPDHSLFTGLLLRGLQGDIASDDRASVTGSELAVYLQRCVSEHRGAEQTPDFGALPWDARGDMVIPVLNRSRSTPLSPLAPHNDTTPPPGPRVLLHYRWLGLALIAVSALTIGGIYYNSRDNHQDSHNVMDAGGDHDANTASGGSVDGDASNSNDARVQNDAGVDTVEKFPVTDANIIDARIAPSDSSAPRPTPSPHPVNCYKLATGGYKIGKPTCTPPATCDLPDAATTNNQSFIRLHCEQLCTCH